MGAIVIKPRTRRPGSAAMASTASGSSAASDHTCWLRPRRLLREESTTRARRPGRHGSTDRKLDRIHRVDQLAQGNTSSALRLCRWPIMCHSRRATDDGRRTTEIQHGGDGRGFGAGFLDPVFAEDAQTCLIRGDHVPAACLADRDQRDLGGIAAGALRRAAMRAWTRQCDRQGSDRLMLSARSDDEGRKTNDQE